METGAMDKMDPLEEAYLLFKKKKAYLQVPFYIGQNHAVKPRITPTVNTKQRMPRQHGCVVQDKAGSIISLSFEVR